MKRSSVIHLATALAVSAGLLAPAAVPARAAG